MLLLTGKIKKYKVFSSFCLHDPRNYRHFFKLRVWRAAKTRACLLRFSALNIQLSIQLGLDTLIGSLQIRTGQDLSLIQFLSESSFLLQVLTLDSGISRLRSKDRITRVRSTMKVT